MKGVRARPDDDGAAAVEFAIVSVLLFTLLFGILQYGYLMFQLGAANATARESARLAAVGVWDCGAFATSVRSRADANGVPAGGAWAVAAAFSDVAGLGRPQRITDTVTVTITWSPTRFGFPFVPFPPATLTSTAQASIENLGSQTAGCP